jgi:RNA polymerase sigma-70 factor (ECF subfamily)
MRRNIGESIECGNEWLGTGGSGGLVALFRSDYVAEQPASPAAPPNLGGSSGRRGSEGTIFTGTPTITEFGASVAMCIPQLRSLARRLSHSRADAADLVQDTCLRALENWRKFVTGSLEDLKRWLRTMMRHLQYDRSRAPRREMPSTHLDGVTRDADVEPCARWRLVDDRPVAEAVSALPACLRGPYVLFVDGGLSYTAIAKSLGIPQNTVGTRIGRARQRLRRSLRKEVEEVSQRIAVVAAPEVATAAPRSCRRGIRG